MKWSDWTNRERWLAVGLGLAVAMLLGDFTAHLMPGIHVPWEAISTLVAVVGLPLVIVGYVDNRRAQRLEHRAYLRISMDRFESAPGRPVGIYYTLVNEGRTPAYNVESAVRA